MLGILPYSTGLSCCSTHAALMTKAGPQERECRQSFGMHGRCSHTSHIQHQTAHHVADSCIANTPVHGHENSECQGSAAASPEKVVLGTFEVHRNGTESRELHLLPESLKFPDRHHHQRIARTARNGTPGSQSVLRVQGFVQNTEVDTRSIDVRAQQIEE